MERLLETRKRVKNHSEDAIGTMRNFVSVQHFRRSIMVDVDGDCPRTANHEEPMVSCREHMSSISQYRKGRLHTKVSGVGLKSVSIIGSGGDHMLRQAFAAIALSFLFFACMGVAEAADMLGQAPSSTRPEIPVQRVTAPNIPGPGGLSPAGAGGGGETGQGSPTPWSVTINLNGGMT